MTKSETPIRLAVRAYRKPGGCVTELRAALHVGCTCNISRTVISEHTSRADAEHAFKASNADNARHQVIYCKNSVL